MSTAASPAPGTPAVPPTASAGAAPAASPGAGQPAAAPPVVDPRDAAFVQRETALQKERAKLAAERQALDAEKARVAKALELDAVIQRGDPLEILRVAGKTAQDFTAAQLAAIERAKVETAEAAKPATKADVDATKAALERKFKEDLEGRDRLAEQRQAEALRAKADADARQWEADAQAYIDAHADDLILTGVRGSGQALAQLVLDDARQRAEKDEAGNVTKWPAKLLSIEEAARKFEEAEAAKDAKIAERRKAKEKPAVQSTATAPSASAPAPAAPPAAPAAPAAQQPRAITADLGATSDGGHVFRSRAEAIAAATAAARAAEERAK